jgi:hypothetical protein
MALNTSESLAGPPPSVCPRCRRPCPPVIVNETGWCCASKSDRATIEASLIPLEDGRLWAYEFPDVLRVAGDALETGRKGDTRSFPWGLSKAETVPAALARQGGTSVPAIEGGYDIAYPPEETGRGKKVGLLLVDDGD